MKKLTVSVIALALAFAAIPVKWSDGGITITSANAQGDSTTASGTQSHAEGADTIAGGSGTYSDAEDTGTDRVFAAADSKHDGVVSRNEWQGSFDRFDRDGDSMLNRDEQNEAQESYPVFWLSSVLQQFGYLDTDHNNQLSRKEISAGIDALSR